MKKIYFLMIVAMIVVTSGMSRLKAADPAKAKAEVMKAIDDINMALKNKDVKSLTSFLTDDGLFCGSDPTEFWDKTAFTKQITDMMANASTPANMNMTMDKPVIRMAKDGMSAIVIGQYTTEWSKPIMVRTTRHFVKVNGKWGVDFMSVALIPDNKDLPKITEAVK